MQMIYYLERNSPIIIIKSINLKITLITK